MSLAPTRILISPHQPQRPIWGCAMERLAWHSGWERVIEADDWPQAPTPAPLDRLLKELKYSFPDRIAADAATV